MPSPSAPAQTASAHQTNKPAAAIAPNPPQAAALPNPITPAEFFARARQLSDLEASGIPFHLKATFVASGDAEFKGNGTYEEWWKDKDRWRKEATLGDFQYVAFKNGAGNAQVYTTSNFVPSPLNQTVQDVLIRIPANTVNSGRWKLSRTKVKGMEFISLRQQRNACVLVNPNGDKCIDQVLFTPDGVLRIESANGVNTAYNGFLPFHGLLISRKVLAGYAEQDTNLAISIDVVEPLDANSALNPTEIPPGLRSLHSEALKPLEISGQVHPPRVLVTFAPDLRYEGPRRPWLDSRVAIELVIDAHGNVADAHVLHSGGRRFDDSALNTVRRYRFAPATLHGVPVPVKLVVVVDFRKP